MRCIYARINHGYGNSRAGKVGGRLQIMLADDGGSGLRYVIAGNLRPEIIHHGASRQAIQDRCGRLSQIRNRCARQFRHAERAIILKALHVRVCGNRVIDRRC